MKKTLSVAIIGAPNAGKSTLLNRLCGEKVSIVTPTSQTTRFPVAGIVTRENTQVVYMDTPGIFKAKGRFESAMVSSALNEIEDADLVLAVVDTSRKLLELEKDIINKLNNFRKPGKQYFLVLNKLDRASKENLMKCAAEFNGIFKFDQTFMVSSVEGDGTADLEKHIFNAAHEGEWIYPEDEYTNLTLRQIAEELTREKLFLKMRQELPHSLKVETEKWQDFADRVEINQQVVVERESQKKIIVGKGGQSIKEVGTETRQELERMLGRKVNLFLFVKVIENWKDR